MARIPRNPRNNRPSLNFYGRDDGSYIETDEYLLSSKSRGFGWELITGLTNTNDGNIYHAEGVVEHTPYFIAALQEIVDKYPELSNYLIDFDGSRKPIGGVLRDYQANKLVWEDIEFLHGTSTALLPQIMEQGLLPRSITGVPAAYGARISSAPPGNPDAVYLTTQLGAANWAARDAAKVHGGEKAILKIRGIKQNYAIPDIDSREASAEESLYTMGAIGYLGPISSSMIEFPPKQRYRRNADDRTRNLERIYQIEGTLDALANLNAARQRAGQLPQDFLDIWYDYLSEPTIFLNQKGVKRKRTYQLTNEGQVVQAEGYQILISLWDGPQGPYYPEYRLNITRLTDPSSMQIALCLWFPSHRIVGINNVGIAVSIRPDTSSVEISYYINYRSHLTSHPEIILSQDTPAIFDVRDIPEIIFHGLKAAVDQTILYKEKQTIPFLEKELLPKMPEVLSYIQLVGEIRGISKTPFFDKFFSHPSILSTIHSEVNQMAIRHLRACEPQLFIFPERGFPLFDKQIKTRIIDRRKISRKKVYALEIELRYTDILQYEDMDNEARVNENTFGEEAGRPSDLEEKVALGLSLPYVIQDYPSMGDLSKAKWQCSAEVEDVSGGAMDVLITCELEIDKSFMHWLFDAI